MAERQKNIRELLAGLTEAPLPDLFVNKIVFDSRRACEGALFVAVRGFKTDGHDFLSQVAKAGSAAAIVEEVDTSEKFVQIVVPNSRKVLPQIAARFFAPELQQVALAGITGTNGKTTTSFLVRSIFEAGGSKSGLFGTISYEFGGQPKVAWNTTPESADLYEMIFDMQKSGIKKAVLEVSSHALDLNRVDGLRFQAVVFTNLSHDHLDYHRDLENYYTAKKRLFDLMTENGTAVINKDDVFGQRLINETGGSVLTFSSNPGADIFPEQWISDVNGIKAELNIPGGTVKVESPLIGRFNLENIMAAVGAGLAMKISVREIEQGIQNLKGVPGRLESFKLPAGGTAVVDYSHTPDSLEKALKTLRDLNPDQLHVVFGCGGDRDRKKRPLMGEVAQQSADSVIITSDNPRFEDPQQIIDDILAGTKVSDQIEVISNRRAAIEKALEKAGSNDIVLIAGKGHEDYQDIRGVKHPFDDRKIVKEWQL